MKNKNILKTKKRERRHAKIRAKIIGTSEKPRMSVFKSNRFLYVQIIDDEDGKTLVTGSNKGIYGKNQLEKARSLGENIAKKAIEKKIKKVVFDRSGYIYTGKIKKVASAAREGGLKF